MLNEVSGVFVGGTLACGGLGRLHCRTRGLEVAVVAALVSAPGAEPTDAQGLEYAVGLTESSTAMASIRAAWHYEPSGMVTETRQSVPPVS